MSGRDIRVENPQEALIVEQALAMYRKLRRLRPTVRSSMSPNSWLLRAVVS